MTQPLRFAFKHLAVEFEPPPERAFVEGLLSQVSEVMEQSALRAAGLTAEQFASMTEPERVRVTDAFRLVSDWAHNTTWIVGPGGVAAGVRTEFLSERASVHLVEPSEQHRQRVAELMERQGRSWPKE